MTGKLIVFTGICLLAAALPYSIELLYPGRTLECSIWLGELPYIFLFHRTFYCYLCLLNQKNGR